MMSDDLYGWLLVIIRFHDMDEFYDGFLIDGDGWTPWMTKLVETPWVLWWFFMWDMNEIVRRCMNQFIVDIF